MALDLTDYGVTANAIAPRPIDTEMVRAAWAEEALEEACQSSADPPRSV
jgi:NAD(P)-dependent dehydrogenase (short-subunit alcohol dehydrogenase family)